MTFRHTASPLNFFSRWLFLFPATCLDCHADTTISSAEKFAYAANAGWINAVADTANGLVVGDRFLSGYAYAANFGWIHFGDGSPANGIAYTNDSATDYGVNHDGSGSLSGLAYAANVGWISFEQNHGQPVFDLFTGAFSGHAYSANIGWIDLSGLTTQSIRHHDSDSDGLGDTWEMEYFGDLASTSGSEDSDGDGQSDELEYRANTNPLDSSSVIVHRILSVSAEAGESGSISHEFTVARNRVTIVQYSPDLVFWTDGRRYASTVEDVVEDTQMFPPSNVQFFRLDYRLP